MAENSEKQVSCDEFPDQDFFENLNFKELDELEEKYFASKIVTNKTVVRTEVDVPNYSSQMSFTDDESENEEGPLISSILEKRECWDENFDDIERKGGEVEVRNSEDDIVHRYDNHSPECSNAVNDPFEVKHRRSRHERIKEEESEGSDDDEKFDQLRKMVKPQHQMDEIDEESDSESFDDDEEDSKEPKRKSYYHQLIKGLRPYAVNHTDQPLSDENIVSQFRILFYEDSDNDIRNQSVFVFDESPKRRTSKCVCGRTKLRHIYMMENMETGDRFIVGKF